MPEISRFNGIIISMHYSDNKRHHLPHIHAEYGGQTASFAIQNGGRVLGGSLPPVQAALVRDWVRERENKLMEIWNRAVNNKPLCKRIIDGLRP